MTTLTLQDPPASASLPDQRTRRSPARTVALWLLQIGAAAIFLAAGLSKLASATAMVQMFDAVGVGQWFRYVTGSIEVIGALMLLVPGLASFGALALAAVMLGAIGTHLFVIGGNPSMPVVLLAATAYVAWTRGAERQTRRTRR
jgi:putative oxidoreductase